MLRQEKRKGRCKDGRDLEEDDLPIVDVVKRKKQTRTQVSPNRKGSPSKRRIKKLKKQTPTSPTKRRMFIEEKTIPDLMDDDQALMESSDDESKTGIETGSRCSLGELCYNPGHKIVVLKGEGTNGSECSECKKAFHSVCLFVFQERGYCIKCYMEYVVSKCSTKTLFQDILRVEDEEKDEQKDKEKDEEKEAASGGKHTESQLQMFIDNYLKSKGYKMSIDEYYQWRKAGFKFITKKPVLRKGWNEEEKRDRQKKFNDFVAKNKKYETVIKMAKDEWMLATDGVINALRYNADKKKFVGKVSYTKDKKLRRLEMAVMDDWVMDTYGKDFAKKLIDRGEHGEYIQPLRQDGKIAKVKIDEHTITRVKYYPPKYKHKMDKDG
jgi:uncharacterized protein YdbL (DUF1318 family)